MSCKSDPVQNHALRLPCLCVTPVQNLDLASELDDTVYSVPIG